MASQCAELAAQLEGDNASQLAAICQIRDLVWTFSKDRHGCRVVQQALKVAPRSLREELVLELHGHVREAMDSPHANFVIQQVVEIMPVSRAEFVAVELSGVAAQVARHQYGCRVIVRLLEHSATDSRTVGVVNELLTEAHELVRHSFGHFVLQAVLEHGSPCHRHCVAVALRGRDGDEQGILHNVMNRHASCVFETAMQYCSPEDKHFMCAELLAQPGNALLLAQNQFGCFVLKPLLAWPGQHVQVATQLIQEASSQLQGTKAGQKTLELLSCGRA
jgi:hypothetical protein